VYCPAVTDATSVVFVHGLYLNSDSWQPWVTLASSRGYACHSPSWPCHDGNPAALRNAVDPKLGSLTFGGVTRFLERYLQSLPDRPVLIGHSVGGLLVQKLINLGYGRAGVAISSAPAQGILSLDPHFWAANFPHVNPFAGNRPVLMTPERFHYTFCNTMERSASDEAFQRYVVPESRGVPRSLLTRQARINFRADHPPLLFVTGDRDHLTPAAMVARNARAYARAGKPVEFKLFTDRSHFICNQDDWQAVAAFVLDWVDTLERQPA
jgi:pimeloyl-ACP methyl ester carboxylesterase